MMNRPWNTEDRRLRAIDRRRYEKDLAEKKRRHLEGIQKRRDAVEFVPCLHDACPDCVGTGIKKDGTKCIHYLSCPCPRCTLRCEMKP